MRGIEQSQSDFGQSSASVVVSRVGHRAAPGRRSRARVYFPVATKRTAPTLSKPLIGKQSVYQLTSFPLCYARMWCWACTYCFEPARSKSNHCLSALKEVLAPAGRSLRPAPAQSDNPDNERSCRSSATEEAIGCRHAGDRSGKKPLSSRTRGSVKRGLAWTSPAELPPGSRPVVGLGTLTRGPPGGWVGGPGESLESTRALRCGAPRSPARKSAPGMRPPTMVHQ